jgi:hypothetical protein
MLKLLLLLLLMQDMRSAELAFAWHCSTKDSAPSAGRQWRQVSAPETAYTTAAAQYLGDSDALQLNSNFQQCRLRSAVPVPVQ